MLITSIIIALLLSSARNQDSSCDDFGLTELLKGAPRYEYRGLYVNSPYEYSVVIPKSLTGYDSRDEDNHQGFGLACGKPPQCYIFVAGEHNSLEHDTPRKAAMQTVEWLRQRAKKVESETISDTHLGTLKAVRLVVIYTCPGSAERHIKSSTMALSPDKRFLYTLELYSRANRYESDRVVLDQIIRSWKMLSGSRRQRRR